MTLSLRWLAPAVLAAGLGAAALLPAPAHAQNDLARVLVDIADVVVNGGVPYYRHGHYGPSDRLIVQRDRWGNVRYYRLVPAAPRVVYRDRYEPRYHRDYRTPPRGNAYGYWRNGPGARDGWCSRYDRCVVHVERRADWRHGHHDHDRRHHHRDRDRKHRRGHD